MTTETKHTPGPWTFSKSDIFGDIRYYIAQADNAKYTPHYSDVATLIAETVSTEREAIQEANARLIAAAPELLAALKAMVALDEEEHQRGPGDIDICKEVQDAYAAIAKATGETQ